MLNIENELRNTQKFSLFVSNNHFLNTIKAVFKNIDDKRTYEHLLDKAEEYFERNNSVHIAAWINFYSVYLDETNKRILLEYIEKWWVETWGGR